MAPLDVVSAELLDDVLERSDGGALIERLEQGSVFLVAASNTTRALPIIGIYRFRGTLLRYRLRTGRCRGGSPPPGSGCCLPSRPGGSMLPRSSTCSGRGNGVVPST